jgi:hypothetical protein
MKNHCYIISSRIYLYGRSDGSSSIHLGCRVFKTASARGLQVERAYLRETEEEEVEALEESYSAGWKDVK